MLYGGDKELCQNDTIPPGAFIEPWNVNALPLRSVRFC